MHSKQELPGYSSTFIYHHSSSSLFIINQTTDSRLCSFFICCCMLLTCYAKRDFCTHLQYAIPIPLSSFQFPFPLVAPKLLPFKWNSHESSHYHAHLQPITLSITVIGSSRSKRYFLQFHSVFRFILSDPS